MLPLFTNSITVYPVHPRQGCSSATCNGLGHKVPQTGLGGQKQRAPAAVASEEFPKGWSLRPSAWEKQESRTHEERGLETPHEVRTEAVRK